jgi:hypothetical protein
MMGRRRVILDSAALKRDCLKVGSRDHVTPSGKPKRKRRRVAKRRVKP